jgi:hypothetical protein
VEQERSRPTRGSGEQCDKADDFIPLFIGPVYKLHAIAACTAVRNAHREIEADILKGDVDCPRGINRRRLAKLQFHAFGADLGATAELRGFLERQTDGEVDGESRSAIIEFPHNHPISTDYCLTIRRPDCLLIYRHIDRNNPVDCDHFVKNNRFTCGEKLGAIWILSWEIAFGRL